MRKIFWALLISPVFLLIARPVSASPIINEVYPRPGTNEKEWVEIFNDSQENVDLSGWILMDQLSSPSIIYEFAQEAENSWLMEPLSFLVIELENSKLNNSADGVKLINQNNEVIDQLEYIDSESEMSFSLISSSNSSYSIVLSSPTKGIANSSGDNSDQSEEDQATTTEYPNLEIGKIMPCPEINNSEWVTIKNLNDDYVELENWQIKDEANNKVTLTAEENIPELGSIKIFLTKNILNNSGDTVYLFDPNGDLVDELEFDGCKTESKVSQSDTTGDSDSSPTLDKQIKIDEADEVAKNTDQETLISRLKKINSLLKITNPDKSSSKKTDNYVSKQIVITKNSLPKSAIINVIIGGAIISSSGLFFIKNPNEKNY